ncbi:M15 family metallopeptidase [Cellulomonas sp. Marseille-Q8402]
MQGAPGRHRHRRRGRARLGRGAAALRAGARGAVVVGVAALLGVGLDGAATTGTGLAEPPPAPRLGFSAERTAAADLARWDARAATEEPALTAESMAVARAALDAAAGVEALRVSPEPPAALADLDAAVLRLRTVSGTLGMGTTPVPVDREVALVRDVPTPAGPASAGPGAVPARTVLAETVPARVAAAAGVHDAAAAVFAYALAVERSVPVAVTEHPAADVAGLADLERAAAAAVAEAAVVPSAAGRARTGTDRVVSGPLRSDGTADPAMLCPVPFAPGSLLRCDAAEALARLNEVFRAEHGSDLPVGGTYRTYEQQVRLKATKGGLAAPPGTSHHGWGVAVDFSGFGGVGQFDQPLYRWMVEHGPAYGWVHPAAMGPGGAGPHEPWHWEYAGPAGSAGSVTPAAAD